MTYVLFFPHGKKGFQVGQEFSELNFYAHRISLWQNCFNSVLYGRKLFQGYGVDSYVKVERNRLWFWNNQKKLRVETYMGLADHVFRMTERVCVQPEYRLYFRRRT